MDGQSNTGFFFLPCSVPLTPFWAAHCCSMSAIQLSCAPCAHGGHYLPCCEGSPPPMPRLNTVSVRMKLAQDSSFLSSCQMWASPAVQSVSQRSENELRTSPPRVSQIEFIWGDDLIPKLEKDSKCYRGKQGKRKLQKLCDYFHLTYKYFSFTEQLVHKCQWKFMFNSWKGHL